MSILNSLKNSKETLERHDGHQWKNMMLLEFQVINWSLNINRILRNYPKGTKALGYKWRFKIKLKASNMLDEYKAQSVVKGYNQT